MDRAIPWETLQIKDSLVSEENDNNDPTIDEIDPNDAAIAKIILDPSIDTRNKMST